jgi:hypothetical protein
MKKIRLWKLGKIDNNNLLNSIVPTKQMIEKFRTLLQESLSPDGTLDIIWGPDIEVELIDIDDNVENYIVGEDGKLGKI